MEPHQRGTQGPDEREPGGPEQVQRTPCIYYDKGEDLNSTIAFESFGKYTK